MRELPHRAPAGLAPRQVVGTVYEQATYPEWAFSAYRTGDDADGALPLGAGDQGAIVPGLPHAEPECVRPALPQQDRDASRNTRNFPQAEHTLPAEDIDLPVREGYATHTLVGLNLFLIKMAQQFPQLLGHPHRGSDADAPRAASIRLTTTENAMLDQAANRTADVNVERGHARSTRR